jgi:hypothetical protein
MNDVERKVINIFVGYSVIVGLVLAAILVVSL